MNLSPEKEKKESPHTIYYVTSLIRELKYINVCHNSMEYYKGIIWILLLFSICNFDYIVCLRSRIKEHNQLCLNEEKNKELPKNAEDR